MLASGLARSAAEAGDPADFAAAWAFGTRSWCTTIAAHLERLLHRSVVINLDGGSCIVNARARYGLRNGADVIALRVLPAELSASLVLSSGLCIKEGHRIDLLLGMVGAGGARSTYGQLSGGCLRR
jgi:hypothetical protein